MIDLNKTIWGSSDSFVGSYARTTHYSQLAHIVSFRYTICAQPYEDQPFASVELDYDVEDDAWRLNVNKNFCGALDVWCSDLKTTTSVEISLNGAKVLAHMLEDAQGLIEFHKSDPEGFLTALNITQRSNC
jgi:hypothetical protein